MHFIKPFIYTILYIIFIEIIGVWVFIIDYFEAYFLIEYYALINGLIMATSLIIFTYLTNKPKIKLPQSTSIYWYIFSIVIGLLYIFIQTPLNWIYNVIFNDCYHIIYEFEGFGIFTDINLLSTFFFIPIAEELFFREFLQKNLHKHTTPIVAIGIISILFASIHLPYANLIFGYSSFSFHHAYITLFAGLILGILYYKSKSIGPPLVLHMFWNFMAIIM